MRLMAMSVLLASVLIVEGASLSGMPVEREDRPAAVPAPTGRLAQAILRLQGGPAPRRQARNRYRLVTLLDGKLTARIPI